MKKNKGFTLIELLVVIAIIGILSSVVLASLNTARTKGSDAAIKADLSGVRAQAELTYDTNGNKYNTDGTTAYGTDGDCGATFTANTLFANANVKAALAHVKTQNGNVALACNQSANGSAYVIATPLKGGGYWCIDSTGVSRGANSSGAAYTALAGAAATNTFATGGTACN
jgi:prepilin-type N-terminal cleavage/methylation domain-containing protein